MKTSDDSGPSRHLDFVSRNTMSPNHVLLSGSYIPDPRKLHKIIKVYHLSYQILKEFF